VRTWADGGNEYDRNQWTMGLELRGSTLLYISLLATATFTPRWRRVAFFGMACYFYFIADLVVGFVFFMGGLLADLFLVLGNTSAPPSAALGRTCSVKNLCLKVAPSLLAIIALFVGSQPANAPDRASWSKHLNWLGKQIFPEQCTSHYEIS